MRLFWWRPCWHCWFLRPATPVLSMRGLRTQSPGARLGAAQLPPDRIQGTHVFLVRSAEFKAMLKAILVGGVGVLVV